MSTSLLYHAFGVRDYRYLKTDYREGKLGEITLARSVVYKRRHSIGLAGNYQPPKSRYNSRPESPTKT